MKPSHIPENMTDKEKFKRKIEITDLGKIEGRSGKILEKFRLFNIY